MDKNLSLQDMEKIELSEELESLIEILAIQVHQTWMKQRLEDGWRYGTERNDIKKTHPCLVPYDQLPESEKLYDRNTAYTTIRSIIAAGYKIVFESNK